jgi:glycosyltransferase involved in cell wall biosynthesis
MSVVEAEPDPAPPLLTFGVPVRNGERFLPRLLDSLLAQDLPRIEVVISDNVSDDGTAEICRAAAARDRRVRYCPNETNIGQIENFNRLIDLARGRYLRWIGVDDWLEPDYARRCTELLEAAPGAVGVTTFQDHVDDSGNRLYREYSGPRLESRRTGRRFWRMLWFLTADFLFLDPVYTMLRVEALRRTRRLQITPRTDQVLAAELSLLGPFLHLPACLSHRRKEHLAPEDYEAAYRRFHPRRHRELVDRPLVTIRPFFRMVRSADLGLVDRVVCEAAVLRYLAVIGTRHSLNRGRELLRPLKRSLRRTRSGTAS